jgi:hypothetical protein
MPRASDKSRVKDGSFMNQRLRYPGRWWLVLPLAAFGCGESEPQSTGHVNAPPRPAASAFDPETAGTVTGRVTWTGPLPNVPPFEVRAFIPAGKPGQPRLIRENPNAPSIDPSGRGVGSAVVYLRGVPAEKARPWDHAPVRVEQRDRRLHVVQGGTDARVGFVRTGDEVEMVSRDEQFHSLHAGGATFFTLTFPDPGRPRKRRLPSRGVVELSSAAGCYWIRAYLFVDEHPYYARIDAQGRFRLDGVPPGRYEVICWHPSWVEERHDRDPETSLITRVFFRPPVERQQQIELPPRGSVTAAFALSTADYER